MEHDIHDDHDHAHGSDCGHRAIAHGDHVDYLHDGHLHSPHDGHVDEHVAETTGGAPCDGASHRCEEHETGHVHAPGCGHDPIPHGDHVDYLVDAHLHHRHVDHCDDHGAVTLA